MNRHEKFTQDIITATANPLQNDDEDIDVEAVTFDESRSDISLSFTRKEK